MAVAGCECALPITETGGADSATILVDSFLEMNNTSAATKTANTIAIAAFFMIYFFGLAPDMNASRMKSAIASISPLLNWEP